MTFETMNELSLKITMNAGESVFTKAGAFVGGNSLRSGDYQFEKVLLGPQGNPLSQLVGHVTRRLAGENLPLMKVSAKGKCVTFYANEAQHVTVIPLQQGQTLSVESENLLAFNSACKYSVRFLAQGVVSQKGFMTSTLHAVGQNALVAVLTDGNPLLMSNRQDGSVITGDPDAVVCWVGADPGFKLNLSWKNLIGQASGESYMFEWTGGADVVIQPNERTSGLDISIDGRNTGTQPNLQENPNIGEFATGASRFLSNLL